MFATYELVTNCDHLCKVDNLKSQIVISSWQTADM